MRCVWVLLAWCAVVASAREAAAAPLVVDWQAPECAQAHAFRARVRDALRREPESALEQELEVRVNITANANQTAYRLEIQMAAGTRQLELPSCDEAVAAAATVVALSIDPQAAAAVAPAPAPASPPEPKPRPEPEPKSTPAVPAPASDRTAPYLAAFGGASLGDVPKVSTLVGGAAGLRFGRWALGVEGFWIAPQTELLPGTRKGGEVGLMGGGAHACYLPLRGDLSVRGCLAGQAGVWRSRGVGVMQPIEQNDWWLAGVARLAATAKVSRQFGLFLAVEVAVPARRPSFLLRDLGEVHRPSVAAGRSTVGVELDF